jgi:hypothetical protein
MGVGGSCWIGVLVGQCVVVWRIGGVTVVMVRGSSHQLKRLRRVDIAWSWALLVVEGALAMVLEIVKAVDNGVGWCDGRNGEVVMTEVDSVGDAEGLVLASMMQWQQ